MTVISQCQICKGFHIDGCPNVKETPDPVDIGSGDVNKLQQQLSDILFKAAGGISDMAIDEIGNIMALITARDTALIAKITDLFDNAGGVDNPLTTYSHTFYGKDSFDVVDKFEAKDAVIGIITERKK